ncbi:hypothetical protein EPUS_04461 [Endocarpon pusillum Z07020]|uniref:G domain-containing protein n=1 Tax=Endocarpon pusillum (strain Z07020 / HMAS-L-300199) TaxID=1263415 RepID=U1GX37_ENDPU|nr:uncharacterized protein EPUS_04461 [Endocarpon pusillum Z07020]ERF76641.1 hypothetical protein EPUS_04461 [Endocarpon pusillum Z07020]
MPFAEHRKIPTSLVPLEVSISSLKWEMNPGTSAGRQTFLIDTPGFDDTNRCDTEILKEIVAFLTKLCVQKIRVTGLVYVHRITDSRRPGSAVKISKCFKSSVAHSASRKWQGLGGTEAQAVSEEREADRTFRHFEQRVSAEELFQWFLSLRHKVVLNIQRELVNDKLTLDQTEAGKLLQDTSARIKEMFEWEVRQLQIAIDDAHQEGDLQTENELLLQRNDAETALEKVDQDSRDMRINLRQLEAEKGPEYIIGVEEMERERNLNTTPNVAALQTKLKEVQDEMHLLRQDCQQKEKELLLQVEAIRRQDSAKAQDKIIRFEAELSRVKARSREQTDELEDLADRLEAESLFPNGASRVLDFMMRNFAPVSGNRHDLRLQYVDKGRMVMAPRRIRTGDSIQSIGRGGGDGRLRYGR